MRKLAWLVGGAVAMCVLTSAELGAQTAADEARARAQYEQGLRELYSGDPQAALDFAQSAGDLLGSDNPRLAALRVEAYIGLRDWEAARSAYERFFTLNPNAELSRHVANLTVLIDQAIASPESVPELLGETSAAPMQSASPSTPQIPVGPQELALASGFSPTPHALPVESGGNVRLRTIANRGCGGWGDSDPDVILTFDGATGASDLHIYIAQASGDMTLGIQPPEGRFSCNDDQSGLMPGIRFRNAQPGTYRIWVGSYHGNERNATRHRGELRISEQGYIR